MEGEAPQWVGAYFTLQSHGRVSSLFSCLCVQLPSVTANCIHESPNITTWFSLRLLDTLRLLDRRAWAPLPHNGSEFG